ncbi:ATP-binding protein [Candidatus Uhrbacteria bacterium]|nr:ATP-binding protein [Candidatus Uhrbacteria bacterium]
MLEVTLGFLFFVVFFIRIPYVRKHIKLQDTMNPRLERMLELAEVTGRKSDPRFRHAVRRLLLRPDQRLEEAMLRRLTFEAGDKAIEPPPMNAITAADMDCGDVPYVRWGKAARVENGRLEATVALRVPLVAGHKLVLGSTRSGKSCAVAGYVRNLPAGTACWVIDPEADRVYMNLALDAGFLVIDAADFKRNLFEAPPNCPQDVWDGRAERNFRESLFLRDGSMSMLRALLDGCRKEGGPVTLARLRSKLIALRYRLSQSGREFGFYETLKNRLDALVTNPMFDCVAGFNLAELASRNVLFTCGSLGPDDYGVFINDLVSWLSCHFEPDLNPVPRLLVVLEEVHRLTNFQRLRRADIVEPIILDAVRTLAKRRVSLMFVDQVPSELPTQLLANTSFRAVFATIEGRDLDALQRSLSLTPEQRTFISQLPQRACIVQYANPNFPNPFPVLIDDFPLRPDVEAGIAERRQQTLAGLSWVPDRREPAAAAPPKTVKATKPLVSKAALDYLTEIAKDEFVPASWRDQQLNIAISQGNVLRSELEKAGLIALEKVNTRSRAKSVVNTRITDAGYALLDLLKVPYHRPRGKGGWEHQYHQRSIAKWAARNDYHRVLVEHSVDGKSVDVALEGEKRIAVEILVNGPRKEMANLRDLQAGYDEVWFCVKDQQTAGQIRELIGATFGDEAPTVLARVQFRLLGEFQERHRATAD